jgi:hypothetical protein
MRHPRKPNDSGAIKFPTSKLLAWIGATALLFPSARASAQGSPAGPMTPAQPSDQPTPPPKSAPLMGGKPNLAGVWAENKNQSDDAQRKMRESAGNTAGGTQGGGRGGWGGGTGADGGWGGPGGSGRGGGWGVPGGGGQQGGGRGQSEEQAGGGGRTMGESSELRIEQTSSTVKVTSESGRVLALYSATGHLDTGPDSSSDSSSGSSKGSPGTPPSAQWQGGRLVALTQTNGGTITRTYELSPDGRQLYVTTKVENKRLKQPVTYHLVYDPVTVSNDRRSP